MSLLYTFLSFFSSEKKALFKTCFDLDVAKGDEEEREHGKAKDALPAHGQQGRDVILDQDLLLVHALEGHHNLNI